MAPRIAPVRDPDPETADILSKTLVGDGPPLNVFTTLARHPRLLKRFNVLGGFFLTRGSLPARDREIVILRSAWRSGSEYEFGQHVLIGRRAGLTDGEIGALATERAGWPAHDAALVAVADEVHRNAVVSGPTWDALRNAYDEQQLIEVILLAGFYRMLAALLNTVGVERDEGVPGWPTAG